MKKGILWFFTVFFMLATLTYIPSFASLIFLIVAVAIMPIKKWQDFIKKSIPTILVKFKNLLIVIAAIWGIMLAPQQEITTVDSENVERSSEIMDNEHSVVETDERIAEDISLVSMVTEEPTSEPMPTGTPEPIATPEPTAMLSPTATPKPTATPEPVVTSVPMDKTLDTNTPEPIVTQAPVTDLKTYVLNTNTMKFHKTSCRYVDDIKPHNYAEFTGTYEEVVGMGYVGCKVCKPR